MANTPPILIPLDQKIKLRAEPTEPCCGNCRFWLAADKREIRDAWVARCRRHPPTSVLMTNQQVVPQMTDKGIQMVPQITQSPGTIPTITPEHDWCGEWEQRTPASE